jgi:cytochrome c-type biogenesis protein CcmE
MSFKKLKFILGPAVIVAALVWVGYTAFEDTMTYYRTVPELYAMEGDLEGQSLRVQGDVVDGSIVRHAEGVDFVISEDDQTLTVNYIGREPVPDTFANNTDNNISAIITGKYEGNGLFTATGIQAQCTSKYEADLDSLVPETSQLDPSRNPSEAIAAGQGY